MFRVRIIRAVFVTAAFSLAPAVAQTTAPANGGDFAEPRLMPIPADVIIVKGAEPSSSDRSTPLPEDGSVIRNVYQNRYLGLSLPLPDNWAESFKGPPPSESGAYVLANVLPSRSFKGPAGGTIFVTAQDLFFTRAPVRNAQELIDYERDHLPSYYAVERAPAEVDVAGHPFVRFDYGSPVAQLHWVVLSTEIRCHALKIVLSSRDRQLLDNLVASLDRVTLPPGAGAAAGSGAGEVPRCVRDYAVAANIIDRVDPALTDHRVASIPVRILIDRHGRVKHVHILRAFPAQAQKITDALMQWRFKPYRERGEAVEVETGLVFGALTPAREPAKTAERSTAAD